MGFFVCGMMGHGSVTTTEVYSNMNRKRVSQDFQTIVSRYVKELESGNIDTDLMETIVVPMMYLT